MNPLAAAQLAALKMVAAAELYRLTGEVPRR
jgi:hypothetical protein